MRIAIVAGEASGDILGAGLVKALQSLSPEPITFEGIAGPLMQAQGVQSRFPMDRLSVMGLVEVLGRLRELLGIRKQLIENWLQDPPDLFIGIDAPDFNLTLEQKLHEAGIPTVHYVSPSVWAWRQKRVQKIARATDLMLCLLPFEAAFYDKSGVDARFVGHTLADELPLEPDKEAARDALGLDRAKRYVALLPGSRAGEVERLAPLFLEAAQRCLEPQPDLEFIIPSANDSRHQQLEQLLQQHSLPVHLTRGQSQQVMLAADVVLLASGTAALECMLLKTPMVVSYRVAPLSYMILSRMVKVPYVSLPNLLADRMLVPELIQQQATAPALAEALLKQLDDPQDQRDSFYELHQQLRLDASESSAKAVLELLEKKGKLTLS
ncbi:lipid-A-disaccharide synthase [Motiliproteus coralliicola]|uniref:Lipid-A-disaccharide synthase n=1 Tax=Motiliproteus coralliicola TaxID=2283196 RepID=A0A369WCV1_9GAMM|nr:lipid-A-disaccharide synthase [Motiliproteus coralliicola]RDE18524.1 lipid-A-disaccharide synthase [Motiliproteus coralliicola]